jgi:hypothetical protein
VRVETPPEPDDPRYQPFGASPLGGYEDVDEPAPFTPTVPPDDEHYPDPPSPAYNDLDPQLYPALIVIDADTIEGPLASNAEADAPLSFRAQMEWLAGDRDPIDFTRAWLEQWETVTAVGPAQAPVVPRPAARQRLLDPWWATSGSELPPSAGQDAAYGDAGGTGGMGATSEALPSWAAAPFRLIAIVNRVDLASDPCATGGEIRYVYAAVEPGAGITLEMTAILEIPYPGTRPAAEWARAWSDIAALAPGPSREAALERLARDVHTEADPLRARLLTSEIALASDDSPGWEMREFHLQIEAIDGPANARQLALIQSPLDRTPRADVDAARLSEHVLAHADDIRGSGVDLPEDMQAGAAPLVAPDFRWRVLGVSESLRHAFSVQTCNGCHGGEAEALPFQHITPIAAPGTSARVSRFLYDPDAPSDELRRRALRLEALAQTTCEPAGGEPAYP